MAALRLATAITCFASVSATAIADDRVAGIPLGEIGASIPITYRAGHPDASGGVNDVASGTSVGAAVRLDVSILGLFLTNIVPKLRFGDLVGLEIGIASGSLFVGHWRIGLQASYEANSDIGVGFRAYSETIFDQMFGPSSSDLYYNFIVGEPSLRYRKIIVRARFSIAPANNSGYAASDLGASFRVPWLWKSHGADGWSVGADLDQYTYENATGEGVLTRFIAVGVLAY